MNIDGLEIERFEHRAMATSWQLYLPREIEVSAAWAAQQAFDIIDRFEEDLSRFKATSYISQIGFLKSGESLQVSPETYECLELARAVHAETFGAFDVSVKIARKDEEEPWRSMMNDFELDPEARTVISRKDHVQLDLGAIGKGLAIDAVIENFESWEVPFAFADAGGSTMHGLGTPPDTEGWPVDVGPETTYGLHNQALSASGFEVQGAHVIDPRTGLPVDNDRRRSWVFGESAALVDAISTAALVMTEEEIGQFSEKHADLTIMVL